MGQIIDIRSMITDATRLNVEEGNDSSVSLPYILYLSFIYQYLYIFIFLLFYFQDKLLKPLGGYVGYSNEWRELAQIISRVRYVLMSLNCFCTSIIHIFLLFSHE